VDSKEDTNVSVEHTASIFSPETLVCTYMFTRYNPEDQHGHLHRRENLKSQNLYNLRILTFIYSIRQGTIKYAAVHCSKAFPEFNLLLIALQIPLGI
jgi:hypothetical protein